MKKLIIILILLVSVSVRAADTKVTALDLNVTPDVSDRLYIVDDPNGTPASEAITLGSLFYLMDTSAELLAILGDETGTGVLVFGTAPTIDSPVFTTAITATDLIDSAHYAADSIDNEHINWADIDYLGDEGVYLWDDIGNPDADDTITLAGYEIGFSSTLDEAAHAAFTINHTDADVTNATTLFRIMSVDDGDADLTYFGIVDDSGVAANVVFKIGTGVHIGESDNVVHEYIHNAGTLVFYDDSDDTSVTFGPVDDGTTTLGITGGLAATGNVYGSTMSTLSLATGLIDAAGAVDMDYGSVDITDHTFTTDGGIAIIDGSYQFPDADGSPSVAGEFQYDNTVAGLLDGAFCWYDDDAVRYFVDLATLPSDDDYVVAYDADADGWYMKADADSGGATAYDAIGNPTGAGSIGFDDTETATYSTAQNTAGSFFIIDNTVADVTNNVYLLDLDYSVDDGQANADYIKCQDAGGVVFTVQQDGETAMDGGITAGGTIEGATITEGGVAVYSDDEMDAFSELDAIVTDKALVNKADGAVWLGVHDYGGADLELPQASPAVPAVDGGVEVDFTDGTVVMQHGSAHAELGAATDVVVAKLIKSFSGTIFAPDGINDVITVKAINSIEFPHGVVITAVYLGIASDTGYVLTVQNFDDFDTINGAEPTIDTVTYGADTTGEIIDSTPTYATIAAGQIIMISIPATDVDWIHFEIYYYEPGA